MRPNWQLLKTNLKTFYSDLKLTNKFEKDEEYLSRAFGFTEDLWFQQYDSIEHIKMVMLSEAPLFGEKKIYFYNPEAKFTSFFYFDDLQAFFPGEELRDDFQTIIEKKNYVIASLHAKGFIILDLFPFAFNEEDTEIVYRKSNKADKRKLSSSEYRQLFELSYPGYLREKLAFIRMKSISKPIFVHRYGWLESKIGRAIKEKLVENEIHRPGNVIPLINGASMSLDRGKLASEYKKVCDDWDRASSFLGS